MVDGPHGVGDGHPWSGEGPTEDEGDLRLDPWLHEGADGDRGVLGVEHLVRQRPEVGLVHAHLPLDGERGEADLVTLDDRSVRDPRGHLGLLDAVRVLDRRPRVPRGERVDPLPGAVGPQEEIGDLVVRDACHEKTLRKVPETSRL